MKYDFRAQVCVSFFSQFLMVLKLSLKIYYVKCLFGKNRNSEKNKRIKFERTSGTLYVRASLQINTKRNLKAIVFNLKRSKMFIIYLFEKTIYIFVSQNQPSDTRLAIVIQEGWPTAG